MSEPTMNNMMYAHSSVIKEALNSEVKL